MPNHRTKKRWDHPTYRFAFVREHRGMACTVIHGSYPESTGYVWKPQSRVQAMRVLDQRLRIYLDGRSPTPKNIRTCAELFDQFCMVRFPKISVGLQYEYKRYFKLLVGTNYKVTDVTGLRSSILERLEATEYQQNTKRNALKRVRAVFTFGIDQGWLQVNPVYSDMLPDEVVPEPQPYTDEDLEGALSKLKDVIGLSSSS